MYSDFEQEHSRAISKLGGILLILVFIVVSVVFFFFAPDLNFGPNHVLGAILALVFSPFLFFGLSRFVKNRDASILEALRAKDRTFKMPDGRTISLSQLVFGICCLILFPIYFLYIHVPLIDKAVAHIEIDGRGVVTKSENGVSQVTFEKMGKEYVVRVPESFETGKLVFICLPPNGDVSKARTFSVRGPHTGAGMVVMGGLHFVLALSFVLVLATIFMKFIPKSR